MGIYTNIISPINCHSYSYLLFVTGFINFGVTNQAPQVSFNFAAEDLMLVFSYDILDIIFCELLDIYEAISYY